MKDISLENIEKHLTVLTQDIGVRLAGSNAEHQAADYVADQFKQSGACVEIEDVAIRAREVEQEKLQIYGDGQWQEVSCSLLSNALGTDGQDVEAPLVFFTSATDYQRPDLSFLAGKAVVHLGSHIETADHYRRLVAAKPAFVLFVDVRYPGTVATADGMFPSYVHAYGALPIASVAYMDAWSWQEKSATRARLCVKGGMVAGSSPNVIAELTGSDPEAGVLYVGGHHDTQADSVGADDNAVGVAAVLELTRVLSELPRKRTIRLISFGAEEQLSAGSAAYVRRHRQAICDKGRFMLNFDACGSLLGWTELFCCGAPAMGDFLKQFFIEQDEYIALKHQVVPYADHFPFAACGLPSAWVARENCTAGRFFHHRPDDDLSRVSLPLLKRLFSSSAQILAQVANADTLPFPSQLPPEAQTEVERQWLELFGGWQGFGG
jgi:carboxypeptidase Q